MTDGLDFYLLQAKYKRRMNFHPSLNYKSRIYIVSNNDNNRNMARNSTWNTFFVINKKQKFKFLRN